MFVCVCVCIKYILTSENQDHIGTTIKDTRTKSRGRVEVGKGGGTGWGEVEGREKMQTIVTE